MLVAPATFSRTKTAISTDLAHQAGTKARTSPFLQAPGSARKPGAGFLHPAQLLLCSGGEAETWVLPFSVQEDLF